MTLDGVKSLWTDVLLGVPQGCVLGPILFVLYINDLPQVLNNHCLLFADDTKIYSIVTDGDIFRKQQDIDNPVMWSEKWQIPFNVSKCTTSHLGKTKFNHIYTMAGCDIKQTSEEKDLGIMNDSQLKFHKHVAATVS